MRLERVPAIRQLPGLLTPRGRDVVLFDSWRGTYSDNPLAISDALHVQRPDLAQLWVADEAAEQRLPPWTEPVRPLTRAHLAALGRARYVVTNIGMPGYYRKPRGAKYLQTWHGTPLKRIAYDVESSSFAGREFAAHRRFLRRLKADVAKWDALISPNPFSTPILRRAFRYDGRILETGYPRNDLLSSPEAAEIRAHVRGSLGLSESTRAVLYAPTWRDSRTFDLKLDLCALGRRFGESHAFLLRTHPHAPAKLDDDLRRWTIDVARHPDIRELYLAADVLVTDYSSVMFDFAVTRKPMLFFTYDLAHYRDVVRGFYFEFEAEAPGPLLATTDELADALADMDGVNARYAVAYDAFFERFCALEDGHAAERVIDAFFGEAGAA